MEHSCTQLEHGACEVCGKTPLPTCLDGTIFHAALPGVSPLWALFNHTSYWLKQDSIPSYTPCLICLLPNPIHFSLKMEAAWFSKTMVPYQIITQHHNHKKSVIHIITVTSNSNISYSFYHISALISS